MIKFFCVLDPPVLFWDNFLSLMAYMLLLERFPSLGCFVQFFIKSSSPDLPCKCLLQFLLKAEKPPQLEHCEPLTGTETDALMLKVFITAFMSKPFYSFLTSNRQYPKYNKKDKYSHWTNQFSKQPQFPPSIHMKSAINKKKVRWQEILIYKKFANFTSEMKEWNGWSFSFRPSLSSLSSFIQNLSSLQKHSTSQENSLQFWKEIMRS